jgi:hypothetical protein
MMCFSAAGVGELQAAAMSSLSAPARHDLQRIIRSPLKVPGWDLP